MFMRNAIVGIIVLSFASIINTTSTLAADTGVLNAISSAPLPNERQISVQSLDDNDENIRIEERIISMLSRSGYEVSDNAPIVLTFEPRETDGVFNENRRTIIEMTGRDVTGEDGQTKASMKIFNSNSGGVLNRGRQTGTRTVTPPEYRLDFFIDDRSDGKRLWEGWATADLGLRDARTLSHAMVPVLVENMGETVKSEPFELP